MAQQEDTAYYGRRAAEELARGDEATNVAAAAVHYELASRYAALASDKGPSLTLVDGGRSASTVGYEAHEDRFQTPAGGRRSIQVPPPAHQESDVSAIARM